MLTVTGLRELALEQGLDKDPKYVPRDIFQEHIIQKVESGIISEDYVKEQVFERSVKNEFGELNMSSSNIQLLSNSQNEAENQVDNGQSTYSYYQNEAENQVDNGQSAVNRGYQQRRH